MSRSLSIEILLPMGGYDSDEIYEPDEKLCRVYGDMPEDSIFFKRLKIKSIYASSADIRKYLIEKYDLTEENFRNYSLCSYFGDFCYQFQDGRSIRFTEEENNVLKREHIDENIYCCVYKRFSPEIYGSVMNTLFKENFAVIDDDLISSAIKMIGDEYNRQLSEDVETAEPDYDSIMDEIIDYESSMDGKLIINLIIGREIARHVGGRAIAYYD